MDEPTTPHNAMSAPTLSEIEACLRYEPGNYARHVPYLLAQVVALREALKEVVASTVPGDFDGSGEWAIYQELARIRGDIAARALLVQETPQEVE